MTKCSFCGNEMTQGTGKMFVYSSGKIDFYCTNRCEKQIHKLHKKPSATKWTKTYHDEHKKGDRIKAEDKKTAPVKKVKVQDE